jgi:hypothetical protein
MPGSGRTPSKPRPSNPVGNVVALLKLLHYISIVIHKSIKINLSHNLNKEQGYQLNSFRGQ